MISFVLIWLSLNLLLPISGGSYLNSVMAISHVGGAVPVLTPNNNIESDHQKDIDARFMRRAVELARKALGRTSPNPCVGCVLVDKNGCVVGEGWHVKAGEIHAEVMALQIAGDKAAGGTAYVSLEPCNHFGRQPPCTHSLLKYNVKRVVSGIVDPDPRVSGTGLWYLSDNGVEVAVGVEQDACLAINAPFIHRVLVKRPYCILALSASPNLPSDRPPASLTDFHQSHPEPEHLSEFIEHLTAAAAPEADTVVMTAGQADILLSSSFVVPSHFTIIVLTTAEQRAALDHRLQHASTSSLRWILLCESNDSISVARVDVDESKSGCCEVHTTHHPSSSTAESKPTIFWRDYATTCTAHEAALASAHELGSNCVVALAESVELVMDAIDRKHVQKIIIASTTSTTSDNDGEGLKSAKGSLSGLVRKLLAADYLRYERIEQRDRNMQFVSLTLWSPPNTQVILPRTARNSS